MANANFYTAAATTDLSDYLLAVTRDSGDAAQDARVVQPSSLFLLLLKAFPTSLTANERTAVRNALSVSTGLTQGEVETLLDSSGSHIVTALSALQAGARLSYTDLKDTPTIPAGVSLISQTDAEGGTDTDAHSISGERLAQAIDALGFEIESVTTAPVANQGSDGDFRLNTGTNAGLYRKASGSWTNVLPVDTVLSQAEAENASSTRDGLISGRRLNQAVVKFGVAVTISDTAPTSPKAGDIWNRTGATDPGLYIRNSANDDWTTVATGTTLDGNGIVSLLSALTGTERLSYGSLKDTPTQPTALVEMPENEAEAGTASTLRAATARRFKAAIDALGLRFRTGDDLPADMDSVNNRDLFAKTGTSDPGLYWRTNGAWSIVVSPGSGGSGGLSQAQVDARVRFLRPNEFTADDETKLNSVETGAKDDQTGPEIVTLLSGLSGSARLDISHISGVPANFGDITAVSAGMGLTGGGTSGAVGLDVGAGQGIETASDAVSVKLNGTTLTKADAGLSVTTPVTGQNVVHAAGGYTGTDRIPARLISGLAAGGNHPERSGDVDIPSSVVAGATGFANPDIVDVCVADGLVWVLQNRPGNSTARLRAFDPTDDSHASSRDISLDAIDPRACFHNGTHIWVVHNDNECKAYLLSDGSRASAYDIGDDPANNNNPYLNRASAGLATAGADLIGDLLYVADSLSDSVFCYDVSTQGAAVYMADRSLRGQTDVRDVVAGGSAGNISPAGLAAYDSNIYLLDAHRDIIYCWDASGDGRPQRLHSHDFSQDLIRSASSTIVPSGIATDGVHLWVSNNRGGSDQTVAGDTDDKKIFGFSVPAVIHGGLNQTQVDARIAHYGQPFTQAEETKLSGIDTGAQRNPPISGSALDNATGNDGDWAVVYAATNPGIYQKASGAWTRRLAVESRRSAAAIATILNALTGNARLDYDSLKDTPPEGPSSELFTGTGTTYKLWTASGIRTAVHAHRITVRHGTTNPANSLGSAGDVYFKTATGNVTELWLRGNSSWTKLGDFGTGSGGGATWHYGPNEPTGASDGDFWLRDGETAPGLYRRENGSFVRALEARGGESAVYGPFERYKLGDVSRGKLGEFNTNASPRGGWANETHFWMIDSNQDRARAWEAASGDRASGLDFSLTGAGTPNGGFAAGGIAWSVDGSHRAALAFNLSTRSRSSAHDLTNALLTGVNSGFNPQGGFTDGVTAWLFDRDEQRARAFTLPLDGATAAHDSGKDIDFSTVLGSGTDIRGGWSDGTFGWFIDYSSDKIYGIRLSDLTRYETGDFTPALTRQGNPDIEPEGGFMVGDVVWIADSEEPALWAFRRYVSAVDVSDRLTRADLVAGDNISLTPGAGNSVTIAASDVGGDSDIAEKFVGVAESSDASVNINNRELRGRQAQVYSVNEQFTPRGGATDGTHTWICDQQGRRVRGYRTNPGQLPVHSAAFDVPANLLPSDATIVGCAYHDGILWVADSTNREIRALSVAGLNADPVTAIIRDTTQDYATTALTAANSGIVIAGVFTDGTHLWVVDSNMDAAWAWLISSKARDNTKDFTQAQLREASTTINPTGGFVADDHTYITDLHSNSIFTFDNETHAHTEDFDISADAFDAAKPQDTRLGHARPYGGWALNHRVAIIDGGAGPYAGVYGFYAAHTIVSHIIEDLQKKLEPSGMRLNSNAQAGFGWNMGFNTAELTLDPMTDQEVTEGTSTDEHTVSPARLKLAAETHGGGSTANKLERSDLVAGDNITLTPTPGSTTGVTIASTASGGGGGGRALIPEEKAEHGLDTDPYAISGERLQQAIDSRAPGTYISPAEQDHDRSTVITVGGTIEGAVANNNTVWLIGAGDILTAITIAGGTRNSDLDFSQSELRAGSPNIQPVSGFFVGDVMSIVDKAADAIYGYNPVNPPTRNTQTISNWSSAEVRGTLAHDAITPEDAFSDGEFLWLCLAQGHVRAYRLSDKSYVEAKSLNSLSTDIASGFSPVAGWVSPNGSYIWVVNGTTNIAHCFHVATMRREDQRDIPASLTTFGRSGAIIRGAFRAGNYGYTVAQRSSGGAFLNAFRLPTAQADHYPEVTEAEARAGTSTAKRIYTPQRVSQQIAQPVADAITIASDLQHVWEARLGDPTRATLHGPALFNVLFDESGTTTWASTQNTSANDLRKYRDPNDNNDPYRLFRALINGSDSTAPPLRGDSDPDKNGKWVLASGFRTDLKGLVLGDRLANSQFHFDFVPPAGNPALAESISFAIAFKTGDTAATSAAISHGIWIGLAASEVGVTERDSAQNGGMQFYVNLKTNGFRIQTKVPNSTSPFAMRTIPSPATWVPYAGASLNGDHTLEIPDWENPTGTADDDPERVLNLVHHRGRMAVFGDGVLYGIMDIPDNLYPFQRWVAGESGIGSNAPGSYKYTVGDRYIMQTNMGNTTGQFLLTGLAVGRPRLAEQINAQTEPLDLRRLGIPTVVGTYDVQYDLTETGGSGELKFAALPRNRNNPTMTSSADAPQPSEGAVGDVHFRYVANGNSANGVYIRQQGGWFRIAELDTT